MERKERTYEEPVVLTDEELARLPVRHLSAAENAHNMLLCLISYHERMTMAGIYGPDCYLGALRYALSLVDQELEKAQEDKQMAEV